MDIDYSKPVFLKHFLHDCVVRSTWNEKTQIFKVFVRFSHEMEYEIDQSTRMFADATLQPQPITEAEYWSF